MLLLIIILGTINNNDSTNVINHVNTVEVLIKNDPLGGALRSSLPVAVERLLALTYRCQINKHSSRCRLCIESSDPAPLISKLTQRCPAAANQNECLFIRPIALTFAMSVNIDIAKGGGGEADIHDE